MTNFRTVKVIRLNDQVSRIDIDGLLLSATAGGSSIVSNLSSIGDVVGGANNGDVLKWDDSASAWIPSSEAGGIAVTASDVIPDYPCSTANYGLTTDASGSFMWRKLKDQDHYISFDARVVLSLTTLEKGRSVSSVNLVITSCNTSDYPLTGYTAVLFNGAVTSASCFTGTLPTIVYAPDTGVIEPTVITVTAEAGTDTDVVTDSVSWLWKKYWGVNACATITATDILALSSQALASTKAGTLTFNASGGRYLYICWPQSFGTRTAFTVGGLATTFNEVSINICNAYSASAAYYSYKSQELQFGTAISVVVS